MDVRSRSIGKSELISHSHVAGVWAKRVRHQTHLKTRSRNAKATSRHTISLYFFPPEPFFAPAPVCPFNASFDPECVPRSASGIVSIRAVQDASPLLS